MSLASAAVKNPIFQQAASKAVFEAVKSNDETIASPDLIDPSTLDVTEEELSEIKKWARILRYSMIILSTLMLITAWYNIFSVTSPSISATFIALYLTVFSCLICCFEIAFRQVALFIVQNFGFMYHAPGRTIFLIFVAIVFFQLSIMGKVVFSLMVVWGCLNAYVNYKHPKYNQYLKKLHFYHRAMAKRTTAKKQGIFVV